MNYKDLFSIEGKKGFITGGSSGIGKTIATAFAELGADVAIVARDIVRASAAAKEIADKTGRKIIALQCDVADSKNVDGMIAEYEKEFGAIDFAINNAGIFTGDEAMDIDQQSFNSVNDVNLNGMFFTAQTAAGLMKKNGNKGSIISTASMSAHIVNQPQTITNYSASKAGIAHLTKSLAAEWMQYDIRVNSISPGYIKTKLIASLSDLLPIWQEKCQRAAR